MRRRSELDEAHCTYSERHLLTASAITGDGHDVVTMLCSSDKACGVVLNWMKHIVHTVYLFVR